MPENNAKIAQINVNPNGGVPKTRVPSARLNFDGVEGDKQRNTRFHGGPTRAVCLFSLELIEKLQREGHPIAPGTTGENLTISGLDWEKLTPKTQLQIGAARVEILSYTKPCFKIRHCFSDEDFHRLNQKIHPGWSRLYAQILIEAQIFEGDEVRISDSL